MMLRYHPRGEQIDSASSAHHAENEKTVVETAKDEKEQTISAPSPEKKKAGRPKKTAE